jgi:NAD(P)-dependent dehydrogenase (short-subunit alcohol dehydrogenase family)
LVDTPSAHLHFAHTATEQKISHAQAVAEALTSSGQSRLVDPEEIARIILFLAGPDAGSIHGADIPIRAGSHDA